MVDNKIIEIIYCNLSKYLQEGDVKFFPNIGYFKFIISFMEYSIEIYYNFMDDFYRVKIETIHDNCLRNTISLTKSKKFKKDMKKLIRKHRIAWRSFENHINCFTEILRNNLDVKGDLKYIEQLYIPDLEFDGFFI